VKNTRKAATRGVLASQAGAFFVAACAAFLASSHALTAPVYARDSAGAVRPSQDAARAARVAPGARVALLPVVNLSGEKDAKQRRDQILKAEDELNRQFGRRGFTVLPRAEVERALADAKLDLTDEENHNRATLFGVGKALNADLIVFVVITDVDQRRVQTAFDIDEMVGKAKTKTWLLSVPDGVALLSAYRQESQSRSNLAPSFDSGARLIRKSVEGTVRDALADFLKQYPEVGKR
jgi:hypothetical protein